jgi:hypothetical protein
MTATLERPTRRMRPSKVGEGPRQFPFVANERLARGLSRRTFLGHVGAVAAASAIGMSDFAGRWAQPAAAKNNTCASPCGPSANCNSADCDFSNPYSGFCFWNPGLERGPWEANTQCAGPFVANVWYECYCIGCSSPPGLVGCHDCCEPHNVLSGPCTGSYGGENCASLFKCICKKQVSACPTSCAGWNCQGAHPGC